MDAHPFEFVAHHLPLMAVSGLLPPDNVSPPQTPTSPPPSPRRRSSAAAEPLPRAQMGMTLFTLLSSRHRQKHVTTVWDVCRYNGKANITFLPIFNVIHFDKTYSPPTSLPAHLRTSTASHSPLSPFTTNSPVHSDGLIPPAWIRKYRELLPPVWVAFYDLWDWSVDGLERPHRGVGGGPLGAQVVDPIEREKDAVIMTEIVERKKYLQDKGIKLAVVVVLKPQHVGDSNIEDRLAVIRKTAGLDAKNSFFVLPPSGHNELASFSTNIQRSLHDSAITYYREKAKAVKKKRSRLPSPQSRPSNSGLPVQGWFVRYDYKGAALAEFRGDIEGALKNYEMAYNGVVEMLTISVWPVRGRRWAEARTLADTICLKMYRFYLFLEQPAAALAHLTRHLNTFQGLMTSWDVGEGSFEHWAWHSQQYRIFADILDIASRHGFKIPIPSPAPGPGLQGINPSATLQHAGFYYHLAAMCSAERRRRVLDAQEDDPALTRERQLDHATITIDLLTKSYEQFKRYRNSRMTLYLAAEIAGTYYEGGKYGMALKFFERIGKTYRKEGWHTVLTSILRWSLRCAKELEANESAIEYLVELMAGQLTMSEQKRIEVQTELTEAIMNSEPGSAGPRSLVINMDLINSFGNLHTLKFQLLFCTHSHLTLPDHHTIVTCQFQFKSRTTFVGVPVPFQVTLKCHPNSPPIPFRPTFIRVLFSDPRHNQIYQDLELDTELPSGSLELVNVHDATLNDVNGETQWAKKADLRLVCGGTKVFEGIIVPRVGEGLNIVAVTLGIESPAWHVGMNFGFGEKTDGTEATRRKWLEEGEGGLKFTMLDGRGEVLLLRVTPKPPQIAIKVDHQPPAFIDEHYPLQVSVTNAEDAAIQVSMSLEVKSLDNPDSVDCLTLDPTVDGVTQLNDIKLGEIAAGSTLSRTVFLNGSSIPTVRVVAIKIHYSTTSQQNSVLLEKQESLRIPFIASFETAFEVFPQPEHKDPPSLLTPNETHGGHVVVPALEHSELSLLVASIKNVGPWSIDIEGVQVLLEPDPLDQTTKVAVESSTEDLVAAEGLEVWKPGYVFNSNYLLHLTTSDITVAKTAIQVGSLLIKWRRNTGEQEPSTLPYSKTIVPLPKLELKRRSLSITAEIPPFAHVGHPFTLTYHIHNPTVQFTEFAVTVDVAEGFVFSGYKQISVRILPFSSHTLHYNCYPILSGRIKLPKLKVVVVKDKDGVEKEVPTDFGGVVVEEEGIPNGLMVYVMPNTDL